MTVDVATAKQRHHEAVFSRYRRAQCALKDRHACTGRLEADHVIEVRWIEQAHGHVRVMIAQAELPGAQPTAYHEHPLAAVTFDDLVADGRNGWILCAGANQLKYRRLISIDRHELPPSVEDFASEFALEHLLDRYFGGSR